MGPKEKKQKHNYPRISLNRHTIAENHIGDEGMKYLSQALSRNTTLTFLNLRSKHKIKDQQKQFINNQLMFHCIKTTGNRIGDAGAESLGESLKKNVSLTQLDLSSGHKKAHKILVHQQVDDSS